MDRATRAAAKRVGLERVELGAELVEELKRDAWGSTYALRVRNVFDHLGRAFMRRRLPPGEQVTVDVFVGFDPNAVASWDVIVSNGGGQLNLDLLAVTPM